MRNKCAFDMKKICLTSEMGMAILKYQHTVIPKEGESMSMSDDGFTHGLPTGVPPPAAAPALAQEPEKPAAKPRAKAKAKAKTGPGKAYGRIPGGRALRRPEEDIPSLDYVERMERLGPREGESLLAFTMRLAGIRAGRALVVAYAERCNGNLSDASRQMGINRHNLSFHMKQLGLTTAELLKFRKLPSDFNK